MSHWIESELKLLLPGEAAGQRIREALGPGRVVVQENHFFDRPDGALAGARIAVRLRAEDERYLLTLKGDELESPGGALSRRIELEIDVTRAEFEAGRDGGLEILTWLDRLEPGRRSKAGPPSSPASSRRSGRSAEGSTSSARAASRTGGSGCGLSSGTTTDASRSC